MGFVDPATASLDDIFAELEGAPVPVPEVVDPAPAKPAKPPKVRGKHTPSFLGPTGHWEKEPTPLEDWRPDWRPRRRDPYTGKLTDPNARRTMIEKMEHAFGTAPPYQYDIELDEGGRPVRSPENEERALQWFSHGWTLVALAKASGASPARLRKWFADAKMEERITAARMEGTDRLAEEMLEIASTPVMIEESMESYDGEGTLIRRDVKRQDAVAARKLAVNTRQYLISKWAPEKYGEKPETSRQVSDDQAIIAARRRLRAERDE